MDKHLRGCLECCKQQRAHEQDDLPFQAPPARRQHARSQCRLPNPDPLVGLLLLQSRPRRQAHGVSRHSVRWCCGDHQPRGCVHPRTIGGPHRGPVTGRACRRKSTSSKRNAAVVKVYTSSVRYEQTKSLTRRSWRRTPRDVIIIRYPGAGGRHHTHSIHAPRDTSPSPPPHTLALSPSPSVPIHRRARNVGFTLSLKPR